MARRCSDTQKWLKPTSPSETSLFDAGGPISNGKNPTGADCADKAVPRYSRGDASEGVSAFPTAGHQVKQSTGARLKMAIWIRGEQMMRFNRY